MKTLSILPLRRDRAIVIVMAGDWVFVAILEAAAFKRFQTVIPVRPQAPVQERSARVASCSDLPPLGYRFQPVTALPVISWVNFRW